MKKINTFSLLVLMLSITLISSCSLFKPAQTTQTEPIKVASFDYSPPIQADIKPVAIKIAIVNPKFAETFFGYNIEPFKKFSLNMSQDFTEILNARGYTYIGPLTTYDEMVYNDKKTTDLVLETKIEMDMIPLNRTTRESKNYSNGYITNYYRLNGNSIISGKINISLSEPFTKTKVWTKSLTIESTSFSYYSKEYKTKDIPITDIGVYNPLSNALDKIYMNTMKLIYEHLDPQEIALKKKEAQEIKNNSQFNKN